MKRRHTIPVREALRLQPKFRRPAPALNNDPSVVTRLEDSVALGIVIFALVTIFLVFFRSRRKSSSALPDVPWVHLKPRKWFSKLRARTWTTVHYEAALEEAYNTYSKNDQACILSGLDGDTVVLPPSAISWLVNQPDTSISTDESTKNVLQTAYSFPVPEIMDRTIHFDVIKGELTRQVFNVTGEVQDELEAAVDDIWGTDTQNWKSIGLFDAITRIVARINSRVFVGLPLCRNEKYLASAIGFAEDVALSATLLRLLPPVGRFFLAPLITIPNKLHARRYSRMIRPEIERRKRLRSDVEAEKKGDDGNDYLSWLLNRSPPGFQSQISTLIGRMLHLNFASIHTTSFIGTNTLFDLLSPVNKQYIPQVIAEADDLAPLDRRSLQKMHLLDGCLRESSRLASIIGLGINVKVVAEEGIVGPDGVKYPKGCLLGVPSWAIHNDTSLYPDPLKFRPERYLASTSPAAEAAQEGKGSRTEQYLASLNKNFTTTSSTYLAFGHGRHACPGRFFAAQELKLLISYVCTKYEMELEDRDEKDGGRIKNAWIGPNHVPPLKARIRVKRKAQGTE